MIWISHVCQLTLTKSGLETSNVNTLILWLYDDSLICGEVNRFLEASLFEPIRRYHQNQSKARI